VSTTSSAGQATGSQASAVTVQGRSSGSPRRADASSQENADLFSNLLGLLADTRGEPPQDGTVLATVEADVPEASDTLASVIDWLPLPSSALGSAEAGSTGASPADPDGEADSTRATRQPLDSQPGPLANAAPGTDLQAHGPTPPADEAAPAPAHSDEPPAATAMGLAAAARARSPVSAPKGSERPTTLMLQGTDTVNWRSAAATRHEAGATAPSAAALAWSSARSTVTLNHRFGLSQAVEGGVSRNADLPSNTGLPLVGGPSGAHAGETAMGQRQGGPAADAGALATGSDNTAPDELTEALPAEAGSETEETQQQDLRAWTTANLRQASLRVGQGAEEAIDIELSLRGQEVNIEFRTDNAEARNTLQANAGQTLADMLQRSGMQLTGLSVGGQTMSERHPSGSDSAPAPSRHPDKSRPATSVADAAPAPPRSGVNGGTSSLDLFV